MINSLRFYDRNIASAVGGVHLLLPIVESVEVEVGRLWSHSTKYLLWNEEIIVTKAMLLV
jgi:hypothetical protein